MQNIEFRSEEQTSIFNIPCSKFIIHKSEEMAQRVKKENIECKKNFNV
jgi:predicted RNase H-like nuclease